jgi:type VI protein secretion system component VasK
MDNLIAWSMVVIPVLALVVWLVWALWFSENHSYARDLAIAILVVSVVVFLALVFVTGIFAVTNSHHTHISDKQAEMP